MNEYQQALARIIELEDRLALAQAQSVDLGNQLRATFRLLGKSRDLLAVVMDTQLHNDIQGLIAEIDAFYPRGD